MDKKKIEERYNPYLDIVRILQRRGYKTNTSKGYLFVYRKGLPGLRADEISQFFSSLTKHPEISQYTASMVRVLVK
jgi:hypothetical protein